MSQFITWLRDPNPASRRQARLGQTYLGWLRLKRNPLAVAGLIIIGALLLMAAFAPWLATHDPVAQNLQNRLLPPGSPGHFLGTDDFGRDIWSRIVHGARITLYIIALVAVTAPLIGMLVGTVAGYFGGWVDQVLMRITDIFLAFPRLILALALVAVLGPGIENAVLAIALTAWPPYARVARAETLTVRNSDYIAAVRLQGAGASRIIWGHVMPMCLPSVIIRVTLDMAGVILIAAGLGFLGLGAQPPLTPGHLLGTDDFGRDILSRLILGSRITLFIIALVAVTAPVFGLLIGTVAGYAGGWIDQVLMRITDIFLAFPKLILALALVAVLGPGMENAVLAIAITSWPPYARVARAETLTVRNSDYIAAIRLQGAGPIRIVTGHVMPMCLSSVVIRVTLDMAGVILIAAGLGFLGLGVQPPMPEWGAMIASGRRFILDQWWVAAMPGFAILIVSLGFNLLGDGLRDVLDPRSAGR